jgi:hypothetical protein
VFIYYDFVFWTSYLFIMFLLFRLSRSKFVLFFVLSLYSFSVVFEKCLLHLCLFIVVLVFMFLAGLGDNLAFFLSTSSVAFYLFYVQQILYYYNLFTYAFISSLLECLLSCQ